MNAPAWMHKHPCTSCGEGYGFCAQFALSSRMCCKSCHHPTRWLKDPWTAAELRESWAGREMPPYVAAQLARLEQQA